MNIGFEKMKLSEIAKLLEDNKTLEFIIFENDRPTKIKMEKSIIYYYAAVDKKYYPLEIPLSDFQTFYFKVVKTIKVNFLDKKDQIEKYFEENEDDFYSFDYDDLFFISYNKLYFTLENRTYSIDENFVVTILIKTEYGRNEYNSEIIIIISELLKFLGELFKGGNKNVSI